MNIGKRIENLREEKGITKDVLAKHLDVTPIDISYWEKGISYPNTNLIPNIATFFNISIDNLFDSEEEASENEIAKIIEQCNIHKHSNTELCEEILRCGLKNYPSNEILLSNLLYILDENKTKEKIDIAKKLIQTTNEDDIKYDAMRILIKAYYELKEPKMVEYYLEQIPEIYFSKIELDALYLTGEDRKNASQINLFMSVDQSIKMINCLIETAIELGDIENAKKEYCRGINIINSFYPEKTDKTTKFTENLDELKNKFISNHSFN